MAYLHSQLRIPISDLEEWQVRQTQRQEGGGALNYYYRPQRSCEGYVFTGVCLSTGGGVHDQVHPPGTRYTPRDQVHPPGTRYTPWDQVHPPPPDQVHPPGPGAPPWDQVHPPGPGTPPWDQVHPPEIRPLLQTVRILLECILVWHNFC